MMAGMEQGIRADGLAGAPRRVDGRPLHDRPCARGPHHALGVPDPAGGLLRHRPLRRLRRAGRDQRAGRGRAPARAGRRRAARARGLSRAGQRTRQRYRLTDKGADLLPVLVALMQWGDRWLDERRRPGRAATRAAAASRCGRSCAAPPDTRWAPASCRWGPRRKRGRATAA